MNHHKYLSKDCSMKIIPAVLPDSNIAKKFNLGRTKSEALIAKVLCSHTIEIVNNEFNFKQLKELYLATKYRLLTFVSALKKLLILFIAIYFEDLNTI